MSANRKDDYSEVQLALVAFERVVGDSIDIRPYGSDLPLTVLL